MTSRAGTISLPAGTAAAHDVEVAVIGGSGQAISSRSEAIGISCKTADAAVGVDCRILDVVLGRTTNARCIGAAAAHDVEVAIIGGSGLSPTGGTKAVGVDDPMPV